MMKESETDPLLINKSPTDVECGSQTRRWKHFLILPVMVIYLNSVAIHFYVYVEWIQHKVQEELSVNMTFNVSCKDPDHNDSAYLAYQRGQQQTADWQMYVSLSAAVPAAMAVTVLPAYSDVFGRRFLFVIAIMGQLVRLILTTFAIYFNLSIIYIVVAAGIDGIAGTFFSFTSALMAYVADLTTTGKQRTLGITIADGVLLVCMTVGSLATGYFIHYTGYFIPTLACAIALFLDLLLVLFFLPESLDKSKRVKSISVLANLKRTIGFYSSDAFKEKRWGYILLIVSYFFSEFVSTHRSSIEMLYQLGMPFCWKEEKVGMFSAARHAAQGLLGSPIAALLRRCTTNITIAIVSVVSCMASYVLEALATTDVMMYLVPIPATLSFLTIPMIKSIMSDMTPADQQGALFASVVAVQSVALVTSSTSLNSIYATTVAVYRGFVFLVCAGVAIVVVGLLCIFAKTFKAKPDTAKLHPDIDVVVN